jgi:2-polyprenyl-3-methyl-5-hydroxy-6-metoxy-1,4-benzoquinol methylase
MSSTRLSPDFSILDSIKSFLADGKCSPLISKDYSSNVDYSHVHRIYREITRTTVQQYSTYLSSKIIGKALTELTNEKEVNVCSIGCGDGEVDYQVLSAVVKSMPKARVNYYGIDVNTRSCSRAGKSLAELPPNVRVTIINKGILEVDSDSLPKFDVVILAHVHYYFSKNLKSLFAKTMDLCTPHHGQIEVIATQYTPIWRAGEIFDREVCFAHLLLKEMDKLSLTYSTTSLPGEANFSHCILDDFTSVYSQNVLDFFCHKSLAEYPPEVSLLCVNYLKSCLNDRGCCDCSAQAITVPWMKI